MEKVLQFDVNATQLINSLIPYNYFFDLFFSFFSLLGMSVIIWIVILLFLIIFEETCPERSRRKINKKFILYFFAPLLITSLLVFGLKNTLKRPRPNQLSINNYQLTIGRCPVDFSFPSGHAATAFASATVLAFFDKKRKWLYYVIASIIGLSRIYLGCHYFFDVVGGGFTGYLVSSFILRLKTLQKSKNHLRGRTFLR